MEASGGADGASDVSYESVASEGGYEPAADRGRDQLPRIISSSHCVEVFRRVCWVNGAFCCRASSPDDADEKQSSKARKACADDGDLQLQLRAFDPLVGLPPRLMRFDGAMEAWLEELPPPIREEGFRDNCHRPQPRPYASLNDAATRPDLNLSILRAGNCRATLWYFTVEFLQQLFPLFFVEGPHGGLKVWERALLERGCTIMSTHVELGRVHCPSKGGKSRTAWLKALFSSMQASKWSPEGEARHLLAKRRVSHLSMSLGDLVQIGGELYAVGLTGFVCIKEAHGLLPPTFENEEATTPTGSPTKPRTDDADSDGDDSNSVDYGSDDDDEDDADKSVTDDEVDGGYLTKPTPCAKPASDEKSPGKQANLLAKGATDGIDNGGGKDGGGKNDREARKGDENSPGKEKNGVTENGDSHGNNKKLSKKEKRLAAKGKGKEEAGDGAKASGKGKGRDKGKGDGGRWVPKTLGGVDRVDRRRYRAQLQADRERHQVQHG